MNSGQLLSLLYSGVWQNLSEIIVEILYWTSFYALATIMITMKLS